jgi:tight adherence protein B
MFLIAAVFFLVLGLSFAVVLVVTRPSPAERAIEGRLAKLSCDLSDGPGSQDEVVQIIKHRRLSDLGWLDAFLRTLRLAQRVDLLITQAESSWSVGGVLGGCAVLAGAGFAIGYYELPNAICAFVPAIVLAVSPLLLLRWQRSRRLRTFTRHLPDAIDLMSRALRAGHSVPAAIEIVGDESPEPVRSEFREVYRQQTFGLPTREALLQLGQRIPLPELNFVITAMLLQKETGGNLVEVLERTASVIRERVRIEGEIRIYTAQGRMTGWILSLLPVAMFFLLSLANRSYSRVLVDDPTGRRLVFAGLALMAVGGLAIRKIVNVKI